MMRLIWKLLARVYTELFQLGIHFPPLNKFFHQPPAALPYTHLETIHGDISFSTKERMIILEAIQAWEYFANGFFKINLIFDLDPTNYSFGDEGTILRAPTTHPKIEKADGYWKTEIYGLCVYHHTSKPNYFIRELYLVAERLDNPLVFKTTALHELGHYLWMGHIRGHAIMHPHIYGNVLYPTIQDAKEYANKFKLDAEDLRYFLG